MELLSRIEVVITNIHALLKKVVPEHSLKIGYLTVFSQSTPDYELLLIEASELGKRFEANNGYKYELITPLNLFNETISTIRIRKPDIHRPELGCCDLIFPDYEIMRSLALNNGMDIILRKDYEMIEISANDIPVYAYLVKQFI